MGKSNIVLSGLCFDNNLGDYAIAYSTEKMIKEILEKHSYTPIKFDLLDVNGRKGFGEYFEEIPDVFALKVFRRAERLMNSLLKKQTNFYDRIRAHITVKKLCKMMINSETKAVIFVGGGLIKFRQQYLYDKIYVIAKYAQKKNVPVMFSAVGVEGYDDKDRRCLKLKKALNFDCVKIVTTRDDIDLLINSYGVSSSCAARVADPACSLNKYYQAAGKNKGVGRCIGLGVLRENIFCEYGIDFSGYDMLLLYKQLYNEILAHGYECRFFCNGAVSDETFARKVIDSLGLNEEEVLLPRPTGIKELADMISSFDGVIVGRLHASILAYSYDIPSISIVWNNKQVMFGKSTGNEKDFFSVDRFDAHNMVNSLINHIDNQEIDLNKKEKFCNSTILYLEKFLTEIDLY